MDYFRNSYYAISHIFLMLFIYLFVTHRYSKGKTIGICFSSFFVLTISDWLKLNMFPDSDICYVVVTILQIFVTQFTGIYISDTRDSRALFMGLTASNYVIAGSLAASILHIYTESIFFSLVGSFFIHAAILLFLYIKIRETWLECYEKELVKGWWGLCLIPVFFYCGFCFLSFFPYTLYDNPHNIYGTTMFIITMFASYVAVFQYVKSESDRIRINWENVLFETYIKGLESQYYLVEQAEKNLKILRHDMRHYSNMIDAFLEQGEYDEIKRVTEYINGVTDDNKVVKYCENIVIHSILSRMIEKASSLGVDIRLDAVVLKDVPVNDYELAAVIANLLENALIGVKDLEEKGRRYIDAKIQCTQEHLLIQIKNECEKDVIFDSQTGLPKSNMGNGHGLGMQSISAFSDKIGGNVGCFCKEGVFNIIIFAKF